MAKKFWLVKQESESYSWDTFVIEGRTAWTGIDRKSTRLNSSHLVISYAVFCLKKKNDTALPLDFRPRVLVTQFGITSASQPIAHDIDPTAFTDTQAAHTFTSYNEESLVAADLRAGSCTSAVVTS